MTAAFLAERLPVHRISKGIPRCIRVSIKRANKAASECTSFASYWRGAQRDPPETSHQDPYPELQVCRCNTAPSSGESFLQPCSREQRRLLSKCASIRLIITVGDKNMSIRKARKVLMKLWQDSVCRRGRGWMLICVFKTQKRKRAAFG